MVGMDGLEPSTSSLSEMRSNRLSYTPATFNFKLLTFNLCMVPVGGFEPPTQGFSGLCSTPELHWHVFVCNTINPS